MVKGFAFDFDGTIADTYCFMQGLFDKYKSVHGLDLEFSDIKNNSLRELVKKSDYSPVKLFYMLWKAKRIFERETKDYAIPPVKPFAGVEDLLRELSENNLLAVVTSNHEGFVNSFLDYYGFDDYFKIVRTGSSFFGKHKVLKSVVKECGLKSEDFVYVGDEVRDVVAARKAGVKSMCVAWGYNSAETLLKACPDYLVRFPREILEYEDYSVLRIS